jgi:hypothetical protein
MPGKIISTSNYESIAWRVMCRRRDFSTPMCCGPKEVVCDTDSETECDNDSSDGEFDIYGPLFICECGHVERGQDADDCRYLVTVHADCGCTDCDYENCDACRWDCECYQKDVCADCETKYDKMEDERLAALD